MGVSFSPARCAGAVAVCATAALLTGCNLGASPVKVPARLAEYVLDAWDAGDLDGDGHTDLVVGGDYSFASSVYTVLLADGDGGFTAHEVPTSVYRFNDLVLADADEDGALDILATDAGNPGGVPDVPREAYVFLGDGEGGFAEPTSLGASFGRIDAADIDADGHVDLVFAQESLAVRFGDGDGGFAPGVGQPFGTADYVGGDPEATDADGDGDVDVVVSAHKVDCSPTFECWFTPAAAVLLNDGEGTFTAGPSHLDQADGTAAADLDEDGDVDVLRLGANGITTLFHDGAGNLTPGPVTPLPDGGRPFAAEAGDVDGDGHADLVVASNQNHGLVMYGDGAGGFDGHHRLSTAGPSVPTNWVLVGDLLGDERTDVAFASSASDQVALLENTADGRPAH